MGYLCPESLQDLDMGGGKHPPGAMTRTMGHTGQLRPQQGQRCSQLLLILAEAAAEGGCGVMGASPIEPGSGRCSGLCGTHGRCSLLP